MLKELQTSYAIDWTPLFQFTLFAAISTPPNFLWQSFLESMFPSQTLSPSGPAIKAASKNDEKELDKEVKEHKIVETRLNKTNTVMKLFLDMTLGAVINTVRFHLSWKGLYTADSENR